MIKNFTLIIGARSDVPNWHDKGLTHHISIRDADTKRPYTQHFARKPITLELVFEDIVDENWNYPSAWCGPEEKHVAQIIKFACEIEERLKKGQKVVCAINCYAGISRSTAVAYVVLNVLMGMGKEKTCFDEVLRVRDCAVPNPIIAKLADGLLDRRGELHKYPLAYRKMIEDSFKSKDE